MYDHHRRILHRQISLLIYIILQKSRYTYAKFTPKFTLALLLAVATNTTACTMLSYTADSKF